LMTLVFFGSFFSFTAFAADRYCGSLSNEVSVCVEEVDEQKGTVTFSGAKGRKTCSATIDGGQWTLQCSMRTDVEVGGVLIGTQDLRPVFSLGIYRNPANGSPEARLTFIGEGCPSAFARSSVLMLQNIW
jgi:hypothetical protein